MKLHMKLFINSKIGLFSTAPLSNPETYTLYYYEKYIHYALVMNLVRSQAKNESGVLNITLNFSRLSEFLLSSGMLFQFFTAITK